MAHIIEPAKSGRAGCRKCKQKIGKGELRFGHEVANAFDEGETTYQWYHLKCAAEKLPLELKTALDATADEIAERTELEALIDENRKKVKPSQFPYAESAPSGRSSCLVCGDKIAKGELRVAVEREVDAGGFTRKSAGYLHPGCARQYDEIPDDLFEQLEAHSTTLEKADWDALKSALS